MITTQADLRAAFWLAHPQYKKGDKSIAVERSRVPKTQNDYVTDVRVAWCDYVDVMQRDGQIDDALAQRATL